MLLVDDDATMLLELRRRLRGAAGIECVGTADGGEAAVQKARDLRPDVVLMDMRMPGLNGAGATREILEGEDPPKVLALTSFGDDTTFHEALRAGVTGFLLKTSSVTELAVAIRKAMIGHNPLHDSLTSKVLASYRRNLGVDLSGLDKQWTDLLRLVGEGLSNEEISKHMTLAETSVRSYVSRLRGILKCKSRAQLVALAHQSGLFRD